jgi:predicted amidohydrolase YtcJ
MAAADVVVTGTVLTVDESRPTAEALAVADDRIVAVGEVRATFLAGRQVYAL